ncbi:hypothetical protein HRbin36_00587 [bacterium HR36]|nr:hypothetical protein HRbin36_00587 [bacterium HR36]
MQVTRLRLRLLLAVLVSISLVAGFIGLTPAEWNKPASSGQSKLRGVMNVSDLEDKCARIFSSPYFVRHISVCKDGPSGSCWLQAVGIAKPLSAPPEVIEKVRTVFLCTMSPDGRSLFAASRDGPIFHWDVINNRYLGDFADFLKFKRQTGRVVDLRFSRNGRWLVARHTSGEIVLCDWSKQQVVRRFTDIGGAVGSVDISDDGRYLVTTCLANSPLLWNTVTGETLCYRAPVHYRHWSSVRITSGGHMFALGSPSGSVIDIIETASEGLRCRIRGDMEIFRFRFTPDGRMLVVAREGAISIWDLCENKEVLRIQGDKVSGEVVPDTGDLVIYNDGKLYLLPHSLWLSKWGEEPESHLDAGVLENAWNDLAASDSARAFQAMRLFLSHPKQALRFLEKALVVMPLSGEETEQVLKYIEQLAAAEPSARQEAAEQLRRFGWRAFPLIKQARERHRDPEARRRCSLLIRELQSEDSHRLRELRALEILEYVRSQPAVALVRKLADGVSDAPLTIAARESLSRISPMSPSAVTP